MCTTIILHNYIKNFPLIIGNNRDEFTRRNFVPPMILSRDPYVVGAKDLERGGTWLGINERRIFINILNKWKKDKNFFGSKDYESRGTLVTDLLKEQTLDNIFAKLKRINDTEYLPFYMVISNIEKVYFIEFDRNLTINDISDKITIVGNLGFTEKWNKYHQGYNYLKNNLIKEKEKIFTTIKNLLSMQKGNFSIPSEDFSVNLGYFQTTSSTILRFSTNNIEYFFANGKPLNTSYKNYSFLTRRIKSA